MKNYIVLFLILSTSIITHAQDENFTTLHGNKYGNGDTVIVKQITVKKDGKNVYYSDCSGLIYGSRTESNLWKSKREYDIEREYFIQIQCSNKFPSYHQWIPEEDIARLIKRKQTKLSSN